MKLPTAVAVTERRILDRSVTVTSSTSHWRRCGPCDLAFPTMRPWSHTPPLKCTPKYFGSEWTCRGYRTLLFYALVGQIEDIAPSPLSFSSKLVSGRVAKRGAQPPTGSSASDNACGLSSS